MNALAPPKEKPLLGGEGLRKLTPKAYGAQPTLQGWQCEAARLFAEFWRSANEKHLREFCRHVIAIRAHQPGTQ